MAPVEYAVPLLPLDRLLIDQVETVLPSLGVQKEAVTSSDRNGAFQLWEWTIRITNYLHEELDGKELLKHHGGNRNAAYADVLNSLRHAPDGPLAANLFRVVALEKANPSFLAELGTRPARDVRCVPAPDDVHYWSLLQSIYSSGKLKHQHASMLRSNDGFNIWKAMQILLIQSKFLEIDSGLYSNVLHHPIFTSLYEYRRKFDLEEKQDTIDPPEEERLQLFRRRDPTELESWPGDEAKYDANETITDDYLGYILRQVAKEQPLEDPRDYLHLVPWSQLVPISSRDVEDAEDIDDPFDDILPKTRAFGYMLWKPPTIAFKWLHHLRTEEEVLQYCISKNWTLPGYVYDKEAERILFALTPIEKVPFLKQLDQFWDLWNDCAATVHPDNEQIFLLETVPGLQFRSRVEHQDIQAALKYFRNVIEADHAGTLSQRTVADVLGVGNTRPYFDKSLQIIPPSQLSDVSSEPIGHGANGAVYAARWQRPVGVLATTNQAASQVSVVLKEIIPIGRNTDRLQRLLRELNLTYLALTGNNVGCVNFLGVTTLSELGHDGHALGQNKGQRLLLVFERATEGSLLEYLDRILPGLSFMEAWDKIIAVVSNIANGLHSLHRHHIIHRDLHPNNVLVARTFYVNDSEDHAIVTDIGEGKVLDTRDIDTSAGASYGCSEFRAPEVHGVQGWSWAADVFSFGVLCCKILELRAEICARVPIPTKLQQLIPLSDGEEIAPKEFTEVVESCLSNDPGLRPSIRSVITHLDNLTQDFFYEENGYSPGRALKEQPEELLNQIEWSHLNWSQVLAAARGLIQTKAPGVFNTRDSILDD